jgi:potassium channel LctB
MPISKVPHYLNVSEQGRHSLKPKPINIRSILKKGMKSSRREIMLGKISTIFNSLTFSHILLIWAGILVVFGLIYYLLAGPTSHLLYSSSMTPVNSLADSVYFSFITATSTGFGDITPIGYFKIISIFEVFFGLVLLAVVTSKLVSIKQDVIMNEIYEISFNEKINRIRSSLLVFRQNLSRVISNIESNTIRKREISDIYTYFSSLEDNLNEIANLMQRNTGNGFTKSLDPLSSELLFHSVTQSFEKMFELISLMNNNNMEWRRKVTISLVDRCLTANEHLFEILHKSKSISEKAYNDLYLHNKKIVEPMRGCIGSEDNVCDFDIEKIHGEPPAQKKGEKDGNQD